MISKFDLKTNPIDHRLELQTQFLLPKFLNWNPSLYLNELVTYSFNKIELQTPEGQDFLTTQSEMKPINIPSQVVEVKIKLQITLSHVIDHNSGQK